MRSFFASEDPPCNDLLPDGYLSLPVSPAPWSPVAAARTLFRPLKGTVRRQPTAPERARTTAAPVERAAEEAEPGDGAPVEGPARALKRVPARGPAAADRPAGADPLVRRRVETG